MSRQLEPYQLIERSIQKKFHKVLWTPFILSLIHISEPTRPNAPSRMPSSA